MKPTPICSTQRATCSGVRFRLMPACSIRSALPLLEDTARLPCLATWPPAAATTKADAEETLNRLAPSPPVPTISTSGLALISTLVASSRITSVAPVISSMVSLFRRRPIRNAPIWASVASPFITMRITSFISSRDRSRLEAMRLRACFISMWRASLLCSQEVAQQFMALFGHDRLGVELHTFNGQGLVAHAHDFFNGAVVVAGPGSHFQAVGQSVLVDHQAVVTGGLQGIVQAPEHSHVVVVHRRHLAMHHLAGPDDVAAVHLADGLVAQADAQDRQFAGEVANGVHGDARLIRGARARGNHQPFGLQGLICSMVISSLRYTCTSAPSSARYCTTL